jgi:GNAT superfamily N-acetyltransferase
MIKTHQVETEQDKKHVRELFLEYLHWANDRLNEEYGIDFEIESMVERDMAELEIFLPPHGRLLLATEDSQVVGMACLKRSRDDVAEIKRMYVRPEFRGRGIGRMLLEAVTAEARQIGYATIRLDSTRFMKAAHSLYRSTGFHEIEPYPESEIPSEVQQYWVFMEMHL